MDHGIFIGIDSGTQGVKTIALDAETGQVVGRSTIAHQLISGPNGRREQEPQWWWDALVQAVRMLLTRESVAASRVRAISISGQQHGFVPLDSNGEVIRPAKLWCDTETAAEAMALTDELGGTDRAIELTGSSIAAGFTASKVKWLREHEPGNYDRLAMILLPHDYLNYRLTGEYVTEAGDASGTAYFDVRRREWCNAVLRAIDSSGKLEGCLPRLIESADPAGTVIPAVARELGLPENVLVASGGGDNMLAAIGTGNVRPGVVTASLGTSGTVYAYADSPVIDPAGELAAFCSSTGGWLPLACTMNVTVSTEAVRNMFRLSLDEFNAAAASAPPGADGVILAPFFNGERTPALPGATAGFQGLTATNATRENLCRAAIEGPTLGLRYALGVLKRCGITPAEIRLVGGGAKSPLWRQMVADMFDCPVACPVETEAGALGAAIQAHWCYNRANDLPGTLGELAENLIRYDPGKGCPPERSTTDFYHGLYANYLRLVTNLSGYWGSQ